MPRDHDTTQQCFIIIAVDAFACVTLGCACVLTFYGKWDIQIWVQRHIRIAYDGSNYVVVRMNCHTVRMCMHRP